MKFTSIAVGKRSMLASAAVLALVAPMSVQAQEAAEDETCIDEDADGDCDDVAGAVEQNAIVVSGTRIRTNEYDFANPVVAIDDTAIQNSGVTNLTDFLTEAPALTGSYTSNDGSGANAGIGGVGLNLLDLRNLGTQRTLTLIDGRRHVAAVPGSSSVDTNSLPIDLIERVDVVTGGASAIYGADAVTGVVNFVTKRNFEGYTVRAQSGISEEGDGYTGFVSATVGTNFAGGRGNIAANFEYGHDDNLLLSDRREFGPSFRSFYDNLDDQAAGDDPNVPDLILASDVNYLDSSPIGAIDVDGDFLPDFLGDGRPYIPGTFLGSFFESGGSGTPVSTYSGEILPKIDRYIGNLLFSYELTDSVRFFAEGKYARVDSESFGQPTFDFFIGVPTDNPFIPDNINDPAVNVFDGLGIVLVTGRDNLDLGRRGETNRRETYRGVAGIEADVTDTIRFDASYVYGQSDATVRQTNTRFNDRFYAAIDAVDEGEFLTGTPNGNIVCRSNLTGDATSSNQNVTGAFFFDDFDQLSFTPGANSGCVPFNIFSNAQDPASLAFINTTAVDTSTVKQHVATAAFSGDFGDGFALWGDPIGFALGGEYRKEISESIPDPVNTTGLTFGNALFPETGSFDVYEGFVEVRVPIVQDRPGFYDLTANGAARVSEYSTVGTTFTYQGGLVYAPVPDFRIRGTYAQAVRAPNIGELFAPSNQTFAFIDDPCAFDNIDNGSATREANCTALLTNLGLTPAQIAGFTGDAGTSLPGLSTGNVDLSEETAKTITVGAIFQPSFIPGLVMSVDYYDVEIEDAISTPTANTLLELCVDAETLDNEFCDNIDRTPVGAGFDPNDAGVVRDFTLRPQNVAAFSTKGVDFSVRYRQPTDNLGTFNFSVIGNHLIELKTQGTPGADIVEEAGVLGAPEWQVNFDFNWTLDNFNLNYGINYWDETLRFARADIEADPDIVAPEYLKIDAKFVHDMQLRWTTDDDMSFYVGVNNIFDQEPDVGLTFYPVSALGRFFYAGVRISGDQLGF
ncbi:TonB-dependent receptor [Qipengyuania sp. XHP0211]|uniref:TonB-dependent receptor domain-containing protein n=1 Tax=Qipengyuania sp. XHP0211 TaxID=3038079 RepID=UPI00241EEF4A|nr:TonB-dependent receptor [Qipengyuania sp. XHP0211]MDG5749863.1 TonB-dependent receptor [Qipengyuania sp. XHP0211]